MSWRRVVLLSLAFVAILGSVTWFVLERSDAATRIVRRELSALLLVPTTIASTELDLVDGRLTVRGLTIDDPTRAGIPLLSAKRIELDVEIDPLHGPLALHRVAADGLVLDLGAHRPTLTQLLRKPDGERSHGHIPLIELTDATIRAVLADGSPPVEITSIGMNTLPTEGAPDILTLAGQGRIDGLDVDVDLRGTIDTESGDLELRASIASRPADRAVLRWVEQHLDLHCGEIETSGTIGNLEFSMTSRTADGAPELRMQAKGAITGAALRCDALPRHLRNADIRFVASSDRGGDLSVRIQQSSPLGDIDITAEIVQLAGSPSFALRATGKNIAIDEDTLDALRLVPVGRRVIDALQPTGGRGDVELYLRNPQRPDGVAEFDMDIRDVAMSYHGFPTGGGKRRIAFPLPVVGGHGRIRLRDGTVLLERLGAKIERSAGGGDITLSGRIDTDAASGPEVTIDLATEGVAFTPDLRACVGELLGDGGDLFDRLAPSGRADVAVAIRPENLLPGGWSVTIVPRGAAMTWAGFPYRLDELEGEIHIATDGAGFDLVGEHGEGKLALRGKIPLAAEAGVFSVTMKLQDLGVDDELRRAVIVRAPAMDAAWRASQPRGRCSGEVRAWRKRSDGPFELDLSIDLQGIDLRLPVRPWRARQLEGRMTIAGTGASMRITFDALRGLLTHGSAPPARLAMLGTVVAGKPAESDVSLVVRGLGLDGQLGRTLTELGALDEGVWDYLRPSGAVDLVCRHTVPKAAPSRLDLTVFLLDVGSDAPILPRPARKMTGELRIANERLTFAELRADLDGHLVRCLDGVIEPGNDRDPRPRIAFTVAARAFPLDHGFANLFPGPMHDAILERDLSGAADIDDLHLEFRMPSAGDEGRVETTLDGLIRMQDVSLRLGPGKDDLRVDSLHGELLLDESHVAESGGALEGTLRDASLKLLGQSFENLSARFVADAERIVLDDCNGRLAGGTIGQKDSERPAIAYEFPGAKVPSGRLHTNLTFQQVDVLAFLTATGQATTPFRGRASGDLVISRLDGQEVVDAEGTASLRIANGDLGVVPMFTAIYATLPAPERPRFTDLAVDCRLTGRRVHLDSIALRSNILGARGSGHFDLDGYLDIKLELRDLLGNTADPFLARFVEFLTNNIVRFHLYGHLRDLRAEQRWLTERSPRRQPVPPLPPLMTSRPRTDY